MGLRAEKKTFIRRPWSKHSAAKSCAKQQSSGQYYVHLYLRRSSSGRPRPSADNDTVIMTCSYEMAADGEAVVATEL